MQYDFDKAITRRNSSSQKWDLATDADVLPMWVADMDFQTAQPILDALERKVKHGIFGYAKVPSAYYESVINWMERRHDFSVQREWILPTTGVIPALTAIIRALLQPEEKVIVQTPVYNGFFPAIHNNDCSVYCSDLIYQNGSYTIDFDDLENKLQEPEVKLLLLCNPHNPAGRVWTRDELTKVGELCLRYGKLMISDEIHCDLVYDGYRHVPFASISDAFLQNSITCTSPSKSFNLAGLQVANIFVADKDIRTKIYRALHQNTVADISPFAIEGLIAAYNESEDWLQQLLAYLHDNYQYTKDFFAQQLPQFPVLQLEATYLVWIDCSVLQKTSKEIGKILYHEGKVWINEGTMYGEAGNGFIRLNIACPRSILEEGLNRMKTVFGKYA
ncbi:MULTISPECIES: MalY/PatB family protein [Chitinophagaceae]